MANWISDPQWDAQGRPYVTYLIAQPGHAVGDRSYISPAEVQPGNTYGKDARLADWAKGKGAPGTSYLHMRGVWDDDEGKWDRPLNWGNIVSTAIGAGFGGPAVASMIGGAGGGAAPAVAGTVAIPTAAATGGGVAGGLWGTGLTIADLISGGANWFDKIYSANAASSAAATNDAAMREALAFAKQQYADTTKREQERWDATEARRVPYRAASQDVLAEFRKLLGV